MKAKIDENGKLWIERGGKMKQQFCPYSDDPEHTYVNYCGDWCPLFGEPLVGPWVTLKLCHKALILDELIDERG